MTTRYEKFEENCNNRKIVALASRNTPHFYDNCQKALNEHRKEAKEVIAYYNNQVAEHGKHYAITNFFREPMQTLQNPKEKLKKAKAKANEVDLALVKAINSAPEQQKKLAEIQQAIDLAEIALNELDAHITVDVIAELLVVTSMGLLIAGIVTVTPAFMVTGLVVAMLALALEIGGHLLVEDNFEEERQALTA